MADYYKDAILRILDTLSETKLGYIYMLMTELGWEVLDG